MSDFSKRVAPGEGKFVNKKQLQDFIKEILFEKNAEDLAEMTRPENGILPAAAMAVVRTVHAAGEGGDFSKIKPLLDFAFEKDVTRRK